MRIYVAGPVSGEPDGNRALFAETTRRLREAGHDAVNPQEHTSEKETVVGPEFRQTDRYREIMANCIQQVASCDAVCTLTGWQRSGGATAEVSFAKCLGMEVNSVDHFLDRPAPAIKWTGDPEFEPRRGYDGDAGFDLYVSEPVVIEYGGFADVPCGVSVELPAGIWAILTGRSSTLRRKQLLVSQGIIDNGYRGPLFAGTQNLGQRTARVEKGERIAQLIPFALEAPRMSLRRVDALSGSDRGEKAFGSTGA